MTIRRVGAAIITYHPDLGGLRALIESVIDQVGRVVIVDNATMDDQFDAYVRALPPAVSLIRNPGNVGLGKAINQAASWAREQGMEYVLLLDQDSVARPGMVATLLATLESLSAIDAVAAVGPCFVDARTGESAPFVRIGFPFNHKVQCRYQEVVECDFLITSGSLIPVTVLEQTGGMDESLFIDNVDLEWCFRARSMGWRLYGVGSARMEHAIGDRIEALPLGLGQVIVHSPLRLYYMTRNRLLLYFRRGTPKIWIAQDIPRLLLKLARFGILVKPRLTYLRYMLLGVRDGLSGVSGPFRD